MLRFFANFGPLEESIFGYLAKNSIRGAFETFHHNS